MGGRSCSTLADFSTLVSRTLRWSEESPGSAGESGPAWPVFALPISQHLVALFPSRPFWRAPKSCLEQEAGQRWDKASGWLSELGCPGVSPTGPGSWFMASGAGPEMGLVGHHA